MHARLEGETLDVLGKVTSARALGTTQILQQGKIHQAVGHLRLSDRLLKSGSVPEAFKAFNSAVTRTYTSRNIQVPRAA